MEECAADVAAVAVLVTEREEEREREDIVCCGENCGDANNEWMLHGRHGICSIVVEGGAGHDKS